MASQDSNAYSRDWQRERGRVGEEVRHFASSRRSAKSTGNILKVDGGVKDAYPRLGRVVDAREVGDAAGTGAFLHSVL